MARVNDGIAVVGFTVAAVLGLYMLWKILRTPGSLVGEEAGGSNARYATKAPPSPLNRAKPQGLARFLLSGGGNAGVTACVAV
jgi:hypothetical protein